MFFKRKHHDVRDFYISPTLYRLGLTNFLLSVKFVLGLTTTPYRKDGHQKIIHFQCGPIRHAMTTVDGVELTKQLVVRETSFVPPEEIGSKPQIQQIWKTLVEDKNRLALVVSDILLALESGRFPLVISERKQHLVLLEQAIKEQNSKILDSSSALTVSMFRKRQIAYKKMGYEMSVWELL